MKDPIIFFIHFIIVLINCLFHLFLSPINIAKITIRTSDETDTQLVFRRSSTLSKAHLVLLTAFKHFSQSWKYKILDYKNLGALSSDGKSSTFPIVIKI